MLAGYGKQNGGGGLSHAGVRVCRYQHNVLLTMARALLVGLQGIWFIQIAYILFRGVLLSLIKAFQLFCFFSASNEPLVQAQGCNASLELDTPLLTMRFHTSQCDLLTCSKCC